MAKKSFLKKTNPYLAEEIFDSNHPQRISCNKKAKSICRTRRRNLITRKSLVSSLLQVVHQKFSSHLQIHEFGLLTVLIWFTSLKKNTKACAYKNKVIDNWRTLRSCVGGIELLELVQNIWMMQLKL